MQKTGRKAPAKERRLSTCLYPLPDGFFVEFQQWLWYAHKDDVRARLLATTPLVDPRDADGYWDHPDYVYATFYPHRFDYYRATWRTLPPGEAFNAIREDAYGKYVEHEGACFSVGEMADQADEGWKYDWFFALDDPWDKGGRVEGWSKPLPAATSKQQRFEILHRDGFRCQLCGRAAHDGVRLEVDHIMPQSKGGKAVPWNLWTLCADCNGAKSDKYWSGGAS